MREGKPVILYVDDDQDMLENIRLLLEKNGYIMIGARTAEEGLKAYKEEVPDLIILDLMMEEVDSGTVLTKELRALGNTVPIFILSSVGDDMSMVTDYTDLGLAGVLQKPVDFDHLLSIISENVGR